MCIYSVITTYHLLSAICMSQTREDDAVLLVSRWLEMKYPNVIELNVFFNKIIVFNGDFRNNHTEEETKRYFYNLIPEIDAAHEIYVWGAQYSFGIFCAENGIRINYCEEAAGMHSHQDIVMHIDAISPKMSDIYEHLLELGLYSGEGTNIKSIVLNRLAQADGFCMQENMTDFNTVSTLRSLPEQIQKKIIDFFVDYDHAINIPKDSTVIFTQHLANLLLTTFGEQALIYQLLVDYFFKDQKLVIKPHPDDLMYYTRLFPDAEIVRERFPSEFLPFLQSNEPKAIATIYSTAIYSLRGQYKNFFELDRHFEKEFYKIHRYYFAAIIAKSLLGSVACVGMYDVLMDRLSDQVGLKISNHITSQDFLNQNLDDYDCIIVDDVSDIGITGYIHLQEFIKESRTTFIFLNTKEDFCFYDYYHKDIWDDILPQVIVKDKIDGVSEEFFSDIENEIFYVYSKSKKIREAIRTMDIRNELPHVGIKTSKRVNVRDEEYVLVLEGILKATEERLLYYMDKVKKIEKGQEEN